MIDEAINKLCERFGQADGSLSITVRSQHKGPGGVVQTLELKVTYLYSRKSTHLLLEPLSASTNSAFLRRQLEPKIHKAFAKISGTRVQLAPGSDLKHLNRILLVEK